jgi:hypothetical protein
MANPDAAPFSVYIEKTLTGVGTAGNDDTFTIGEVPFDATVVSVTYIPEAAVTGVATNNRTLSVINKGQDGTGSTSVASLTFGNGTNAAAFDSTALTLSGTAANLNVTAGDVLAFASIHNGTGITDPGGTVRIGLSRR